MELTHLCRILEDLEPGMSITIPKDWFSLNVEGTDETTRDVKTIELVLGYNCTWAQDPAAKDLTFTKQPADTDNG
jgi:hypothetical protein